MLTVALPKGRLQKAVLERFARAGIEAEEDVATTRRLIIPAGPQARFVVLKSGHPSLHLARRAPALRLWALRGAREARGAVHTARHWGLAKPPLPRPAP